ncbi:MAG: alginate lyase family protein, partial [Alistipes sp.]|nr:alginate lyase family protein [Alistipes sp.]
MKKRTLLLLFALLLGLSGSLRAQSVWDADRLERVKQSLDAPYYAAAYRHLLAEADALLEAEPLSVMMKEKTPASGDKHDYMSQARYFWPDPSQPDGLPYINRDGVSNPELETLDRVRLGRMAERVGTLALAWYFSGDEKYARKAVEQLRTWFLDKETRMNPHLEYAQVIWGRYGNKGRSYGVLDGYSFIEMLDAAVLLERSKSFPARDVKALKAWFSRLLDWMLTSPQGREEIAAKNNHGTACDAQIVAYALYTGRTAVAREFIETLPERRLFTQIEPDGRQPQELRRTLAFGYSQYNLTHFIDLFRMARKLGIAVDSATSDDGRSFYKAMDFLAAYVGKPVEEWPYRQISEWDYKQQLFCKDLYKAYLLDPARKEYLRLYKAHRIVDFADRFNLLYVDATETDNAYA